MAGALVGRPLERVLWGGECSGEGDISRVTKGTQVSSAAPAQVWRWEGRVRVGCSGSGGAVGKVGLVHGLGNMDCSVQGSGFETLGSAGTVGRGV